jgi:hypothetical protein
VTNCLVSRDHVPRRSWPLFRAKALYLPLDDLLFITQQYINPAVSRSGIARLLKRENKSRLADLIPTAEGEKITPKKTFKDYEPGFTHVDIKYLPQMPDETAAATCSWPSTAPRAGSSCTSMVT